MTLHRINNFYHLFNDVEHINRSERMKKLFSLFEFKKKITIKEKAEEVNNHDVIVYPNEIVILEGKQPTLPSLVETLALAKLGEEDPLLTSFFFKNGINEHTPSENEFLFYITCVPLRDAWSYKVLREYAPDLYETMIEYYTEVLKVIHEQMSQNEEDNMGDFFARTRVYTILAENEKIDFNVGLHNRDKNTLLKWQRYFMLLFQYCHSIPEIGKYLLLAHIIHGFKVSIKEKDGEEYYCVK